MDKLIQNKCFMYRCRTKQERSLQVPVDRSMRKKWFEYAGRQDYMIAPKYTFSCETHYNEISNVIQSKTTHKQVETKNDEESADEYPVNINSDAQMSTICRLCLNPLNLKTRQWYHIFNQHEKMKANENISKMIQTLTGVIIEEDITLPLKLCQTCYKYLCFFNDFKNKCIHSNWALQNIKRAKNCLTKMEEIQAVSELEYEMSNECDKFVNFDSHSQQESYETSTSNVKTDEINPEKDPENVETNETPKKLPSIKIPCLKKVKCPRCKEVNNSREELKYHIKAKHTVTSNSKKPYRCVVINCFNRYNCLKFLLKHHETDHSDPTKLCEYQCNICFKYFTNKRNMQNHKQNHHLSKPLPCEVCGKIFKNRERLNRHSITHTDIRKYVCEICSKAFQNPYTLRVHRRIHTGEKPFFCHLCAQTFSYKCSLDAHLTKQHLK